MLLLSEWNSDLWAKPTVCVFGAYEGRKEGQNIMWKAQVLKFYSINWRMYKLRWWNVYKKCCHRAGVRPSLYLVSKGAIWFNALYIHMKSMDAKQTEQKMKKMFFFLIRAVVIVKHISLFFHLLNFLFGGCNYGKRKKVGKQQSRK